MVQLQKLLTWQLCMLLYATLAAAEKIMRPKFTEIKLWSDPAYVTHNFAYDASDPHMNFTLNVAQDAPDVDLHTEVRVTQKADPTYFFSANSTVNLCRILNWRAKSPLGTFVHTYLQEYGKLVDACPITKGHYYLHKIWIPEDTATALIPEFEFEVNFQALVIDADKKRTLVINDHITGEGVVQDVSNVKRGFLAMLPKAG